MKPNFFDEDSPYLQHPLLTPERTQQEVDFVVETLGLVPGDRVLDVGCGFGRHSIALAQRGFEVVGIDPSTIMIAQARANATLAQVKVDFRIMPASKLPYLFDAASVARSETGHSKFDAGICLFTTFGQISGNGNNSHILKNIYATLKPGGRLLVEIPQRAVAVQNLKVAEQFGTGESCTKITRKFDAADQTITENFEVAAPKFSRKFLLRYRLYSRDELKTLFNEAGFLVEMTAGNYGGDPLCGESLIMLMSGIK